jgi:hypothetical protein
MKLIWIKILQIQYILHGLSTLMSLPSRSATKLAQAFRNPEKVTGVQLAPLVKSFAKIASISSLPGNISHTAE